MLVFLVLWVSTVSFKNHLILFCLVCAKCVPLEVRALDPTELDLQAAVRHWGPLEKQYMPSTNESFLQPTSSGP